MNLLNTTCWILLIFCVQKREQSLRTALSRRTVVRRANAISEDLLLQLQNISKEFLWYSLALDESTDVKDTAQLLVSIRGLDHNFTVTEELLSIEPLKGTSIGQDMFESVKNCMEKNGLLWNRMASITTDGTPSLTGRNIGLIKLIDPKIKETHPHHSLLSFHRIIQQ